MEYYIKALHNALGFESIFPLGYKALTDLNIQLKSHPDTGFIISDTGFEMIVIEGSDDNEISASFYDITAGEEPGKQISLKEKFKMIEEEEMNLYKIHLILSEEERKYLCLIQARPRVKQSNDQN